MAHAHDSETSSIQDDSPGAQAGGGVAASSSADTSPRSPVLKQRRCQSMCPPRRLSYIGNISSKEEKSLHNLYSERNTAPSAIEVDSVVPETVPEIREIEKAFDTVVATDELT